MEIVNAISLIESADMSTVNKTLTTISNFQKVVQATLKDGFDFGVIPGTPKPTLYKPGAEKICQLMKVSPEYEFLDRVTDFDKGFFNYELRCTLFHNLINEKGELIRIPMAQGVGSCNSMEKKYRWQNVQEKDLPDDVDKSTLKSTTNKWGKTLYTIENTDPYTLANTILKMAKKRCLGSTTPVIVKTDRRVVRTNVSKLYSMIEVTREPIYLPGNDGTWREIIGMTRQENKQVYAIKLADNSVIRATGNHRFPTTDGLKSVSELIVGNSLVRCFLPDTHMKETNANKDIAFVAKEDVVTYNQKDLNKIIEIKEETKPSVVYDIEVDGDHLFCLANGIVSHNSFIDATLQLAALSQIFGQDLEDIKDLLASEASASISLTVSGTTVKAETNDPGDFRMEKGKFAGVPLSKLYDDGEINYIEWLATKINNPEINKIASEFLLSKGKPNNPIIPTKTAFEKAKDVTEQAIPFPDDKDCPLPFDL